MNRSKARRPVGPLAALLLAVASPAAADMSLGADLYNHDNLAYLAAVSGSTPPQAIVESIWYTNSLTRVNTVANPGHLSTYLDVTGFPQVQTVMSSRAWFRIDDLFLSDGTGIAKPVNVSFRFEVEGLATSASSNHDENVVSINGILDVTVGADKRTNLWSPVSGRIQNSYASNGVFTGLSDPAIQGTFVVGPFQVMTEQNISLQVENTAVSGPYTRWGEMQGVCSFRSMFPRGVPAIVLPEGFVANSTQGRIEDNWFVDATVSADGGGAPGLELAPCAPNPFADGTSIAFTLPAPGAVSLDVYDVSGRRVMRLASGTHAAGRHVVRWAGADAAGRRVPAGAYYCTLQAGEERRVQRMVRLR